MDNTTIVAIVGILATLVGSILGGAISHVSAASLKRKERVSQLAKEEIAAREALYAEVLVVAAEVFAIDPEATTGEQLRAAVARLLDVESRCTLRSEVVAAKANEFCCWIANSFSEDGRAENAQMPKETHNFTSLRDAFIAAARSEVDALKSRLK